MVVLFVGCGCVAEKRKTYYSYVENLRRDSFLSCQNGLAVKLLTLRKIVMSKRASELADITRKSEPK